MPPPPLLGYNNNVRHRGRIFHIQTEDSGLQNPRIMTHLFADGGRIVKSRRTDYSEHIGRDDTVEVVRGLMKEQHKAMFVALRCGEFDALIGFDVEAPPPSLSSRGVRQQAEELTPASNVQSNVPQNAPAQNAPAQNAPAQNVPAQNAPAQNAPAQNAPAQNAPAGQSTAQSGASQVAAKTAQAAVAPESTPAPVAVPAESLDQPAPPASPAVASPDAAVAAEPPAPPRRASRRPPKPAESGRPEMPRAEAGRPYAAPRPASIFAEAPQAGESLFGEAAMDEKSLDSAILSYLSEDEDEE